MPLTGGFDKNEKLLIIHADDVGMCHTENKATFLGFRNGVVSSCSLMMPCPWILEAVEFFKENPDYDHGIHSTLTSEWRLYRWGPVSSRSQVPTLLDEQGYLHKEARDAAKASKEEVEAELRAQVKRAFQLGLRPSHLDTHMGLVFFRPDILETYVKVALDNGLIPMLIKPSDSAFEVAKQMGIMISEELISKILESGTPMLDNFIGITFGSDLQERIRWFRDVLKDIKPGTLTQMIVHLGLPDEEMKAIIPSHSVTSHLDRHLDYQLVTSR
ncbi:MAG: polysaccharide deacetylase family protein, partial [Crenarchaeota archaeon]|nr:polysaccharide deacetylase family protein [Thermoproteota archaeon]